MRKKRSFLYGSVRTTTSTKARIANTMLLLTLISLSVCVLLMGIELLSAQQTPTAFTTMIETFSRREQYKQALNEIDSQQIPLTRNMIDYLTTIINTITTFTTIPVFLQSLQSWNIDPSHVDNMLTMKKSQLLYNTQLMDYLTNLRAMILKQMDIQTSSIKQISAVSIFRCCGIL